MEASAVVESTVARARRTPVSPTEKPKANPFGCRTDTGTRNVGVPVMNDLPRKLPIWPGAPAAAEPKKHVLQRRGPDCAIAAAATITGVTYDQAASAAFSLRNDGLGALSPPRHQGALVSPHRPALASRMACSHQDSLVLDDLQRAVVRRLLHEPWNTPKCSRNRRAQTNNLRRVSRRAGEPPGASAQKLVRRPVDRDRAGLARCSPKSLQLGSAKV